MNYNIAYITGTRADFGRAINTLYNLKKQRINPNIIAIGPHFSKKHGYTISEVKKEKFNLIGEFKMESSSDNLSDMVDFLSDSIRNINKILRKYKIDLMLVLGDRGEMLAGAIAASHLNIPVAHIGGGQHSGSIDDKIRDAITVFSNIHFCATEKNKQRIKNIIGSDCDIYVVGAPDIDMIKKMKYKPKDDILKEFNIKRKYPIFLFMQHPVTNEIHKSKQHMQDIIEAIKTYKANIIAIVPNTDAGGYIMRNVLSEYKDKDSFNVYQHISYKKFLNLMKTADLMIGNSSAGIIESASFQLPVINIGTRQDSREQSGNVINVPYNKKKIIQAIKKGLSKEFNKKINLCKNVYGEGETGEKIAEIIYSFLEEKSS